MNILKSDLKLDIYISRVGGQDPLWNFPYRATLFNNAYNFIFHTITCELTLGM